MAELGTSIAGSQEPDSAHHQRSRLASGAGDLISSSKLNLDLAAPPPGSKDDESFGQWGLVQMCYILYCV